MKKFNSKKYEVIFDGKPVENIRFYGNLLRDYKNLELVVNGLKKPILFINEY
jgi:hypothetical protein